MIILIGSEKGGVGKSTLATNIVTFLAAHDKDVILVDFRSSRYKLRLV